MADPNSSQEKTERPTEHKLRKQREKGNVWQSRDLTSVALLAAALVVLINVAPAVSKEFLRACESVFLLAGSASLPAAWQLFEVAARTIWIIAVPLGALFVIAAFAGGVASYLQVGSILSPEPLTPKLEKLNPIPGLKNLLFSVNTWVELAKTLLKVVAVGAICATLLWSVRVDLLRLAIAEPWDAVTLAWDLGVSMAIQSLVAFTAIAVIDVFYQRWNYIRQNKMSKDEVKREYKQMEGDPEHKAERKRLHEEIALNQMFIDARESSAMIPNPSHLVCALRYDPKRERAPRLIAKGKGWVARRLLEIAKEEGIPVYRDVRLARTLFEVGMKQQIPVELFPAVEAVFSWVDATMRARGQTPPWDESLEQTAPSEPRRGTPSRK